MDPLIPAFVLDLHDWRGYLWISCIAPDIELVGDGLARRRKISA